MNQILAIDTVVQMPMSFVALLNWGCGEIILVLALILILFGSKKLPELAKGLGKGINEFRKATREVADEIAEQVDDERPNERINHPVLMGLTLILGAVCLVLLLYELFK